MVTLVVATTIDPASVGPASALLSMPGWHPGPSLQRNMSSFVNKEVRLLKHDNSIVKEDHLDKRWEAATGEVVDEVIFLSKHTAVSNRPALTVHPIGVPHLRENDVSPAGGKPGWAAPPNPRIGPWLKLLKTIAQLHNLTPEFEVTLEATHHGPEINSPTMFVEIGSTEEYWKRQDAAQAIALLVWEGLGLGGGDAVGDWSRNNGKNKILLGLGGGHYVPRHMDIILKDDVWVGHLLSGYSLLMEDPGQSKAQENPGEVGGTWREAIKVSYETTKAAFPGGNVLAHIDQKNNGKNKILLGLGGGHYVPRHMDIILKDDVWVGHLLSGYSLLMEDPGQSKAQENPGEVGGTWREAIKVSYETTKAAFPGGNVLAHIDQKSFKGWQRNVIMSFLAEQNIKVGKPGDFC